MASGALHEDRLVERLRKFVRFPSQQTELQERDPAIKAFIENCAAPEFRRMGLAVRYDPMGNMIVEAGPQASHRSIMFIAYAMTHPAARMEDPFSATLIDTPRGRAVRGRGVAEQKTALAAACGAVAEIAAEGKLGGRLIFALTTAGETGRHDAVQSVLGSIQEIPRFAVVCIGTDNKVAVGNKGRIDFDVIVKGKASHSSAPWNGVNAITGARRLLEQLEGLDLKVADHPAFGPATLTPTAIDSNPKATHTVPDAVRVTFDRRLLPGEEPERAFEQIRSAIALDRPWQVECRRGPVMYPNEIALDGPLFRKLTDAFRKTGRGEPGHLYCNFALDAGYLGRQGIEAVMLGPGDIEQFHSDEEHVLVSDLVAMAKIYHALIKDCLS